MKNCTKCRQDKLLTEFYIIRTKPSTVCKTCTKAYKREHRKLTTSKEYVKNYNKKWREENQDKVKLWQCTKGRNFRLKNTYGITEEQYNDLLIKQNNCCAICNAHKDIFKKALYVDHCHITGVIRGLLCQKCNSGLGLLNDNVNILQKALDYLKKQD